MEVSCDAGRGTRGLRRTTSSGIGPSWQRSRFAATEDPVPEVAVVTQVLWPIPVPPTCLHRLVYPYSTSLLRLWKLWSLAVSWNHLLRCTNRYQSPRHRSDSSIQHQRGPLRYPLVTLRWRRKGTSVSMPWSASRRQAIKTVEVYWISARRNIERSEVRRLPFHLWSRRSVRRTEAQILGFWLGVKNYFYRFIGEDQDAIMKRRRTKIEQGSEEKKRRWFRCSLSVEVNISDANLPLQHSQNRHQWKVKEY